MWAKFKKLRNKVTESIHRSEQQFQYQLSNKLKTKPLQLGIFPDIWKDALVCHIFKGGDAVSVSNYRPISLLICSEKVPEHVIFKHLYNLSRHPFPASVWLHTRRLNNQPTHFLVQHFLSSLGCVVFCDISKSFDCILHKS